MGKPTLNKSDVTKSTAEKALTSKSSSSSKSSIPTLPTPTLPQSQALTSDSQNISRKRNTKSAPTSKQIIRDLGLKVTSQRQVILEVVRSEKGHFTAQDIF